MAGLRERKKEQARQHIADVALRLFLERGFEAVTVNEIARAADVAKATLFAYFPTKESLVMEGVADDDLAAIVSGRPAGQSILDALRAYFTAMLAQPEPDDSAAMERTRVILASPVLRDRATAMLYGQRQALARALAAEYPERAAALIAAQISATILTLQESYFADVTAGVPACDAGTRLAESFAVAFDLLENGITHVKGRRRAGTRNQLRHRLPAGTPDQP